MGLELTIRKYQGLINEEIALMKKEGSNSYILSDGVFVNQEGNNYIYLFKTEYEITMSDSYPVSITIKGEIHQATIINIEPDKVLLAFNREIRGAIDKVYMACDPGFLLEALRKRLNACQFKSAGMARYLIENGKNNAHDKSIPGKREVDAMVAKNKITFVWGPPGSGKTTTLANLAYKLVMKSQRVLMVSQSNISVDEAILKIRDNFANEKEYRDECKIIRYGYIKNPELKDDKSCNPYLFAFEKRKQHKKRIEQIKKDLNDYVDNPEDKKALALKREKVKIEEEIANEINRLVKESAVVATTISKATIDPLIYEGTFDVVIFDEASMAYVPQIIFAASLARKKFLCFGDLNQLPPISNNEQLQLNIYDFLGMVSPGGKISHQWLVILEEQYRSHPAITKFVNANYYNGRIKDAKEVFGEEIADITAKKPFANQPLVLLDTSGYYASAIKTAGNSRVNIVNATIALACAIDAAKNQKKRVGIITPYAAQARLIRKMLKKTLEKRDYQIDCATVHQFQGSQRDIIILDTVESYPGEKLGILTSDKKNQTTARLVNVAVTRARGKLIVIGNLNYWKTYATIDNPFLKLMKHVASQEGASVIGGFELKSYLQKIKVVNMKVADDENSRVAFIQDLDFAKESIVVSLTNGENIDNKAVEMLTRFGAKNGDNKSNVAVNIKVPKKSAELARLEDCEQVSTRDSLPLTIIDKKTLWYALPEMNRYYNLKKQRIRENYKLGIRIEDADVVKVLDDLLNLRNDVGIEKREEYGTKLKKHVSEIRCPECDGRLRLKSENHFYVSCPTCQTKEYLKCGIVNDFLAKNDIVCPNDDGKLTARIEKYGMVLRCSERHAIAIKDFFEL